jgi:hypothetical protein
VPAVASSSKVIDHPRAITSRQRIQLRHRRPQLRPDLVRLVRLELELHGQEIPQGGQTRTSAAPYRRKNCEAVLRQI